MLKPIIIYLLSFSAFLLAGASVYPSNFCESELLSANDFDLENRQQLFHRLIETLPASDITEYLSLEDLSLQSVSMPQLSSSLQILKQILDRFSEPQRIEFIEIAKAFKATRGTQIRHYVKELEKARAFGPIPLFWSSSNSGRGFGFTADSKNFIYGWGQVGGKGQNKLRLSSLSLETSQKGAWYHARDLSQYAFNYLFYQDSYGADSGFMGTLQFAKYSKYEFFKDGTLKWRYAKTPFPFFRKKKKSIENWVGGALDLNSSIYLSKALNKIIILGRPGLTGTGSYPSLSSDVYAADVDPKNGEPSRPTTLMMRINWSEKHCIDPEGRYLFSLNHLSSDMLIFLRQIDLKTQTLVNERLLLNVPGTYFSSDKNCFLSPNLKYLAFENSEVSEFNRKDSLYIYKLH